MTWRQSCLCALPSALIAYSGVKSNPTNKPCVHCISVCCVLDRAMMTCCLPLSCNAQRGIGRLLKRMQQCLVLQLLHSKVLPCHQPCSLASLQVSTCTHIVQGTTYPFVHCTVLLVVSWVDQFGTCGQYNGHVVRVTNM